MIKYFCIIIKLPNLFRLCLVVADPALNEGVLQGNYHSNPS